jgi:hypothetical protein
MMRVKQARMDSSSLIFRWRKQVSFKPWWGYAVDPNARADFA